MKPNKKTVKKMLHKPAINPKVQANIKHFDLGANLRSHQYKALKSDRYDALSLLKELVNESNYDWRVSTSQSHLIKILKTNQNSLNFDLLSLDRLGLIHIDITQLASGHDNFNCEIIPHKVF
ncbi:hypothetical protein [Acetilactobacillus jinshanensis]|uniref:Uncharacterized protein n=1 Tax=Acetilactobacillus jinshanensis TaxID=1720083 RepID=A0A4V1ALL9_9LACO|nr:hypothetical protein [Acetilactobacillus jinshanensis]QBP18059.1 hypothetical protein ELX58_02615 [Acetilactobacillus jinshanensis]URL60921.1 hypothetical protein HGK75_02650 [uncultured bacterium]